VSLAIQIQSEVAPAQKKPGQLARA
jgi:hypothetical protein